MRAQESTERPRFKIRRVNRKHPDIRFQAPGSSQVAFAARIHSGAEVSMPIRSLRATAAALLAVSFAAAAQPPPAAPQQRSARAAAPAELTGNWVAQVTEDWRWRMITPPKGDYASVPLNADGRKLADAWDLAKDDAAGEQCRAFGAGGIMRQPTRLRIAWTDENTLRVETDAGQQTRQFHFDKGRPRAAERSWQGDALAEWIGTPPAGGFGFGPPIPAGPPARASLKVVSTNLKPGYLRRNGVPYSEAAVVTEYYDRLSMFGNDYLQVVTVVVDPKYLTGPFVVSNQFKREPDGSKWRPMPCATEPPIGTLQRSPYVP
jgi:hypothetical protein